MTTALVIAEEASARTRVAGLSQVARSVLSLRRAGIQRAHVRVQGDATQVRALLAEEGQGFPVEWELNGSPCEGPILVIETTHIVDVPHPDRVNGDAVVYYEDAAVLTCPPQRAESLRPLLAEAPHVADLALRVQAAGIPIERRKADFFAHPVADADAAERALIKTLTKPSDGPLARLFDRKISGFISRRLVLTPLTPNHVTLIASAVGILGAFLISLGHYWTSVAGCALFVFCTILDGCDGEVARLKFRESHFGYLLDLVLDNVVYFSIFAGVAIGIARSHPDSHPWLACILVAEGIVVNATVMYLFVLRTHLGDRIPFLRWLEWVANGDFSYAVFVLSLFGGLNIFLWGSVIGLHVFVSALISYLCWMRSNPDQVNKPPCPVKFIYLDARSPNALLRVGGVPAAGRILRAAHYAGVPIMSLRAADEIVRRLATLKLVPGLDPFDEPAPPMLYAEGGLVVDPRIIEAMIAHGAPCRVATPGEGVRLALLDAANWDAFQREGRIDAERLPPLDLSALKTYSREQRAEVPLYVEEVTSQEQADQVTERLLLATQKKVLDLPAEYIDPPFENAITRALVNTPVSPNQVTILCALVAGVIAWMFLQGWLWAGVLATYLVEWLDGVDGKLARLRLQFSELGKNESTIDYFCENAWWACLGSHFAHSHAPVAWWLMGLFILSDTLDNLWFMLCGAKGIPHPSEFGKLDSAFHRIAGRRNIYCAMMLIGLLLLAPWEAYVCCACWAFLTQAFHIVRILQRLSVARA